MKTNKKTDDFTLDGLLKKLQQNPAGHLLLWTILFLIQAVSFTFVNQNNAVFFFFAVTLLVIGIATFDGSIKRLQSRATVSRSLAGLSKTNAVRNRGRSVLCVALMSCTVFLVLSISAFRLDPQDETRSKYRGNGNGGFDYIAETAFPVLHDVNTPQGRAELGIQPKDESFFAVQPIDIVPIRSTGGDNAGCLNLYQTGNPRVWGVPCGRLAQRQRNGLGAFRFAAPKRKMYESTPWSDLSRSVSTDSDGVKRVPVILDQNTAMYALHLYKGIGEIYELPYGSETLRCEVVGLLSNSVLQGAVLMSDENLKTLFPDISGTSVFLIGRTNVYEPTPEWLNLFSTLLEDYGLQSESTAERLRKLFAVQNTYLSAFQSLGGVGLLLGVFGLAVIQIRNVFERRKELALFQAIGFKPSRVILMLLYENLYLLFWGLFLATLTTVFALLPFFLSASQEINFGSAFRQFVYLVGSMVAVGIVSNVAASLFVLKIPIASELAEERGIPLG